MTREELIDDIYSRIKADPVLRVNGERFVPGEGALYACRAYILGEAPGAIEAMKGRPFIGPAGRVQRQLMALAKLQAEPYAIPDPAFGLDGAPANCWLTNVLHYRPLKNRRPFPKEIAAARPYIVEERKAVGSPSLIIPVGGAALEAVLGRPMSILKASGKCILGRDKKGKPIYVWPMIHPAFGLRNKAIQATIERDWLRLAEWVRTNDTEDATRF